MLTRRLGLPLLTVVALSVARAQDDASGAPFPPDLFPSSESNPPTEAFTESAKSAVQAALVLGFHTLQRLHGLQLTVMPELIAIRQPPACARSGGDMPTLACQPPVDRAAEYVSICMCVVDMQNDIVEWVQHHIGLGVSKIYLFDRGSSPPLLLDLLPYVQSGHVEYFYMPHGFNKEFYKAPNPQIWLYNFCVANFRERHQWMAFVVGDEFIMLRDASRDLPSFLQAYEQFPGLRLHWWTFSSSGHVRKPQGGVLCCYTRCWRQRDELGKEIANLDHAEGPVNVHHFKYRDGVSAVDEHMAPLSVKHYKNNDTGEHIFLAHYCVKSREDFAYKVERGSGTNGNGGGKDWDYFSRIERSAKLECVEPAATYAGYLQQANGGGGGGGDGDGGGDGGGDSGGGGGDDDGHKCKCTRTLHMDDITSTNNVPNQ